MTTATPVRAWTWPKQTTDKLKNAVAGVLWELYDNGDIEAPSGTAVPILRRRLEERPRPYRLPPATAYLFRQLEEGGRYGHCIDRQLNGTAVRSIRLRLSEEELPRPRPWPAPKREEPAPEPTEQPAPEVEPAPVAEPEATFDGRGIAVVGPRLDTAQVPVGADDAIAKLLLVQSLATDVILDLAEMAGRQAAQAPSEDGALLHRMSQALEENNRLRRNLAEVTETLRARTKEVDTVRKALRQTQANLDALRTGSQVNDSGFRALNKMMTERPRPNGR